LRERRAVAERWHHVHVYQHNMISSHTYTPRTFMPCHYRHDHWHPLKSSITTYSSLQKCLFVQASPAAASCSCTTHPQKQDANKITSSTNHDLCTRAVTQRCRHSSHRKGPHACGAKRRGSWRGKVAVTPPESCWSAWLLRQLRAERHCSNEHTQDMEGAPRISAGSPALPGATRPPHAHPRGRRHDHSNPGQRCA
jgi:hypothetical protein